MYKKIAVIIGARGIGDLIYHLPLLRSLYKSYNHKLIIFSNKVNKANQVFENEKFVNKIIEFDNRRYSFFKTIKNSIIFKNKLNSYNFDRVILTSNARRLILPVILCNALKKDIMGNGKFIFNKDRSLDHLTISERLLKYTKDLKLPVKIQNFFLKNYKSNSSNKNIFISIDSHHNQNNWPLQNYIKLIKKINNKKIYLNFSPNHKYFLNFFKKENIKHKKIIFTYNKSIKEIIKIIKKCGIIIGNESGPVCLGASYKKKVHAIYLPIHTKPESKIIYKNSVYYNASKISDSKIINRILKNILSS